MPFEPSTASGASILMTLAPQSASCRTASGPERTRVRSRTVKRDKGMGLAVPADDLDPRSVDLDLRGFDHVVPLRRLARDEGFGLRHAVADDDGAEFGE